MGNYVGFALAAVIFPPLRYVWCVGFEPRGFRNVVIFDRKNVDELEEMHADFACLLA
jgi:hypothetical protein